MLHYALISLNDFTIQMISICKDVERIQKCMREYIQF
jgi:hypothetical protein